MSTGGSHDHATLHVGSASDSGDIVVNEIETEEQQSLVSQGESADHAFLHAEPDKSEWVTCLPECHWADDGSDPASGRSTPKAIHTEGCPHFGGRYIEHIPAPSRGEAG